MSVLSKWPTLSAKCVDGGVPAGGDLGDRVVDLAAGGDVGFTHIAGEIAGRLEVLSVVGVRGKMRRGLVQEVFEAIGGLQHLLLANNIVCHVETVPIVSVW